MATSTGRVLYLSTTTGIYGYSIQSDNVLKPLSPAPLISGSFNQVAATPGIPSGQSSPLLLAVASGSATAISTWPLNGDGTLNTGGEASVLASSCSSFSHITGIAAVPGNQYVLAVDGTSTSTNAATIPLPSTSGLSCATAATSNSTYPVQPALDCSVPGSSSSCILFLTLSSTSLATTAAPEAPVEDASWSTATTGTLASSSGAYTCTPVANCPLGVAFDPATLYFYATFNGTSPPSLQSIAPNTTTSTGTTNFPASTLNYPCVDTLGGMVYVPTANGYLYAVSAGSGGSVGSPQAVLSPGNTGTTGVLTMTSCAISSNP